MSSSTLSVAAPLASPLETFVACAHEMLDPATPEAARRRAEPRLLAALPALQAIGVFELFAIRDPALAALVRDELEVCRPRRD